MISCPVCESRFPVGSSARINSGELINARATATRCCSPTGQLEGFVVHPPAKSHPLQQRPGPGLRRLHGLAGDPGRQAHVLQRRQLGEDVIRLKDKPNFFVPKP